jgi:cbb3-type cytochrome oxidase maturation protein
MSAIILLIGISLALSAGFVAACLYSIRDGQFDDLETPRWRLFFSDSTEALPLKPGFASETQARNPDHDPH